jgi:hypothetical protein
MDIWKRMRLKVKGHKGVLGMEGWMDMDMDSIYIVGSGLAAT